jgi:hypothetical protein
MSALTTTEQEIILTYIQQRVNNIPVTVQDLPPWLYDLERQRRHFQAIVTIYRNLPYMAKQFIPASIRETFDLYLDSKEILWTK